MSLYNHYFGLVYRHTAYTSSARTKRQSKGNKNQQRNKWKYAFKFSTCEICELRSEKCGNRSTKAILRNREHRKWMILGRETKQLSRSMKKKQNDSANTHISLGIRLGNPPSLITFRRALSGWPRIHGFFRAGNEDWSHKVDAQADLSLHWAHKSFCWICRAKANLLF